MFLLGYKGWVGKCHWVVMPHQGTVHSNLPGIAFGGFLFLGAAALAVSSFSRSTAEQLLLRREFPLFLGDTLFLASSGSLTGSYLEKDFFFFLGRLSLPVIFKITTNKLLLEILFARYWEMCPLFLTTAWPTKVEWKMSSYFLV